MIDYDIDDLLHSGNIVHGDIVKSDDRYVVTDNTFLNNLVLSSTRLQPNKATSGHSHEGQEEVYFFQYGYGEMEINDEIFAVAAGDIVQIPDGAYHRVYASDHGLYFICVFDGGRKE